jgi:hypothetical protein
MTDLRPGLAFSAAEFTQTLTNDIVAFLVVALSI